MSRYRELMRMKLLEEMYDKMSPEEKREFVRLTMQDKSQDEIMSLLRQNSSKIEDVHEHIMKQTWLSDFSSNIAGNAVFDGFVWLVSRLIRKL